MKAQCAVCYDRDAEWFLPSRGLTLCGKHFLDISELGERSERLSNTVKERFADSVRATAARHEETHHETDGLRWKWAAAGIAASIAVPIALVAGLPLFPALCFAPLALVLVLAGTGAFVIDMSGP